MKTKYLYIIIALLCIVIVSLLTYEKTETYVFKSDNTVFTHNFGTIKKEADSIIEIEINYLNKEFDSLKVYDVKDGCDCTNSNVRAGVYKKNETISIKTFYNPNKYNDSGETIKQIFLRTNKKTIRYDTIIPIKIKGFVK